MLYFSVLALLVSLAASAVRLVFRDEYVVTLHWPKIGWFVLVRGPDGRYTSLSPVLLPVAVARFTVQAVAARVVSWPRRARAWAHAHRPSVLGAKI